MIEVVKIIFRDLINVLIKKKKKKGDLINVGLFTSSFCWILLQSLYFIAASNIATRLILHCYLTAFIIFILVVVILDCCNAQEN